MSSPSYVYTGPWINHSHGTLIGSTITLTTRDAAFLLAVLAIIVTTAGHSFWTILSYISHQARSNANPHDVMFHQQQAILRNSGSALDAAWKFSRAIFAWRKHANSRKTRPLLFILMAIIIAALFIVASIFSSQVTKAVGTEVLLVSENCGFWSFEGSALLAAWKGDSKTLNQTLAATNYVNSCYNINNTNSLECNLYVSPSISWTVDQNASCPFGDSCLLSPTAAYQMDTGQMDSHLILGLNAKKTERVTVRKRATCAPLHIRPYTGFVNQTYEDGNVDLIALVYLSDDGSGIDGTNITYNYNLHSQFIGLGYDLKTVTTLGGWIPAQPFNNSDSDVSMFFFTANTVLYIYPNYDPIFGASTPLSQPLNLSSGQITEYESDLAVTTMGCTDQYQICNPNILGLNGKRDCTPLGPLSTLWNETQLLGMNLYQYSTVETLISAMHWTGMYQPATIQGASALQAQSTVVGKSVTQFAPLPNSQWQIEVSNWFAVGLATLQEYLVETVHPTNILEQGGTILSPGGGKYGEAVCQRQMIRSTAGHQNFSVLGVAIILIIGTILIILGLVIDTVGGWVQQRFTIMDYQRLSWVSDGYLQLQRLAHEGAGNDDWAGCADAVPVSKDLEQRIPDLAGLDIWDLEHPRLVQAPVNAEASPLFKK